MKSIARLLSVVALLGALNVAKADSDWMAGAKLGLGMNNTDLPASLSQTRFLGGLWLDGRLAPMFHFQPELLLNTNPGVATNATYVDVPLLLKVKFDAAPTFKPYLVAGLQLGFKLSDTPAATNNTINFGIPFGAGFEYEVAPAVVIGLDIRYVLGLSDLSVAAATTPKSRYLQFAALVGFAI